MRTRLLALLVATALVGLAGPAVADGESARVVHVVLVWLNEPGNPDHRSRIVEATRRFSSIPGVEEIRVGEPVPGDSPNADTSFDVGLYMVFSSKAALESYLAHPEHRAARQTILRPLAKTVVVYDFFDDGRQ